MTQTKWPWFERKFQFDFPPEKLPDIRERLAGTTPRLRAIVAGGNPSMWSRRLEDTWSIQENVGHLADLEPLWLGRLDDLRNGLATLREADLTNQATFDADHHGHDIQQLIDRFERLRQTMLGQLDALSADQYALVARHPRLDQPMRVVDLCYFVAEHDDYHLARIRYLLEHWQSQTTA